MSEEVFVVSKGIVETIVRGDEGVFDWLKEQTSPGRRVLLPYSCVPEGLGMASAATYSGLHGLARLLCMCELIPETHKKVDERLPTVLLTPDALLSCLQGTIPSDTFKNMAEPVNVTTSDAALVTALLSVDETDHIDPGNLARALEVIHLKLIDPTTTCRPEWPNELSPKFLSQTREKAAEASSRSARARRGQREDLC